MSALSIGLTGLQVDQQLLNLTGENITNASTPGYDNQVADLTEIVNPGSSVGDGVSIATITREVNQVLEQAVNSNASDTNNSTTQLSGLNQVQSFLTTGSGTLHDSLADMLNDLETLTTEPDNPTQREQVLSDANSVATQLNSTAANLHQVQSGLATQANTYVSSINTLTTQIAQLNQQIQSATFSGQNANMILDQHRDEAVANLSQLIGVTVVPQSANEVSVFAGGTPLVLSSQATAPSVAPDSQGNLVVTAVGSDQPVSISGGELGGTLTLANSTLPAITSQLNTFTQGLVSQFDEIQATGLGLNGPMTQLNSQRAVSNVNTPLASANLAFPPQQGDLYITVVNQSTGQQTLSQVAIDPATQSLSDVASAISGVPNVQAVVNSQTGTLDIMAAPGYSFEFTGALLSSPDSQSITGTTTASISGQYTGSTNGALDLHLQRRRHHRRHPEPLAERDRQRRRRARLDQRRPGLHRRDPHCRAARRQRESVGGDGERGRFVQRQRRRQPRFPVTC